MSKILVALILLFAFSHAELVLKRKFFDGAKKITEFDTKELTESLSSKEGIGDWDYRYGFGANLTYDIAYIDTAYPGKYSDMGWRRVRLSHEGSFFDKDLFYEIEYSFLEGNHYKDLYVGYEGKIKDLKLKYRIKAGNIKPPFGLEGYSSSKYNTFMENSLLDPFYEDRKLGVELLLHRGKKDHQFNLFLAYLTNSIDEREVIDIDAGFINRLYGRFTYCYEIDKNHLLSTGFSFMNATMNDASIRYNQKAESDWIHDNYVSTRVKHIESITNFGLEALYIYKRLGLQAEYIQSTMHALNDYTFKGYYLQASYFLTKDKKRFNQNTSTIARIKTKGALELAARYSYLNLNDKDELGGTQRDYNFGLNYYINNEFKAMINYVVAEPKSDRYDGRLQLIQGRLQYAF